MFAIDGEGVECKGWNGESLEIGWNGEGADIAGDAADSFGGRDKGGVPCIGEESNGDGIMQLVGDSGGGDAFNKGNKCLRGSWSFSSSSTPAKRMSVSVTTVSVVVSGEACDLVLEILPMEHFIDETGITAMYVCDTSGFGTVPTDTWELLLPSNKAVTFGKAEKKTVSKFKEMFNVSTKVSLQQGLWPLRKRPGSIAQQEYKKGKQ